MNDIPVPMVHIRYHRIKVNENATHELTFQPFPFSGSLFLFLCLVYRLKAHNIYTINTHIV